MRLLIEKDIFRDPYAVSENSVELLRQLSERFSKFLSRRQFDLLLERAAHRAQVDLSQFQRDTLPLNLSEYEMEQIGTGATQLLIALMNLLSSLIGEGLVLRQLHLALAATEDVLLRNGRSGLA
jgi:hypothetical protein